MLASSELVGDAGDRQPFAAVVGDVVGCVGLHRHVGFLEDCAQVAEGCAAQAAQRRRHRRVQRDALHGGRALAHRHAGTCAWSLVRRAELVARIEHDDRRVSAAIAARARQQPGRSRHPA